MGNISEDCLYLRTPTVWTNFLEGWPWPLKHFQEGFLIKMPFHYTSEEFKIKYQEPSYRFRNYHAFVRQAFN
jgi:hypothetical protein